VRVTSEWCHVYQGIVAEITIRDCWQSISDRQIFDVFNIMTSSINWSSNDYFVYKCYPYFQLIKRQLSFSIWLIYKSLFFNPFKSNFYCILDPSDTTIFHHYSSASSLTNPDLTRPSQTKYPQQLGLDTRPTII
jgi:hypothetical protein